MTTFQIPKTQKAAVLFDTKEDYRIETDWPVTQPNELKPGECLVNIKYSGVCHSDLHVRDADWPRIKLVFPLIGGHEGVGVVVAIGEHTAFARRKSLIIACESGDERYSRYEMCLQGNHCSSAIVHGVMLPGTFQEYAVSKVNYVTKLPDVIAELAPILCAGLTVHRAIKTSGAHLGQWIAIPGAGGGLGHLAIQYAVAQGLRVVAIDTGEEKKRLSLSLGAEKWVDFRESKNLVADVKAATGDAGPHVALVAAGASGPIVEAIMYLRNGGTLMCVGSPAAVDAPNIPITLIVAKSLKIIGGVAGNRLDADEAVALASNGKVQSQCEIRNLEDLNTVFKDMKDGKITGRIVLKI
ncbi:hypothetical protein Ac2012v2_003386 [Leucoagaricus gongylophorus]